MSDFDVCQCGHTRQVHADGEAGACLWYDCADCDGFENEQMRNELTRLREENATLRRELHSNGIRECDVPACNCGPFHDYRRVALDLHDARQDNEELREENERFHNNLAQIATWTDGYDYENPDHAPHVVASGIAATVRNLRLDRDRLRERVAELEKDKERMDWMCIDRAQVDKDMQREADERCDEGA